jgi:hypothetical protein
MSLFTQLSQYYQMYNIPDGMLQHGMELVNPVIDMGNSTGDILVLFSNNAHLCFVRMPLP